MTIKSWLLGLLNALVSGAASSLAVTLADNAQFNFSSLAGLKHIGAVAAASGVVSLAKYLVQYHIPGIPPNQGA